MAESERFPERLEIDLDCETSGSIEIGADTEKKVVWFNLDLPKTGKTEFWLSADTASWIVEYLFDKAKCQPRKAMVSNELYGLIDDEITQIVNNERPRSEDDWDEFKEKVMDVLIHMECAE